MKDVDLSDIERLSHEIEGYAPDSEVWANRVGLDPEILDALGNVSTNMAREKTLDAARKALEESGLLEDMDDLPAGIASGGIKMDVGEIIKEVCISMFILGFETARQFGGGDTAQAENEP